MKFNNYYEAMEYYNKKQDEMHEMFKSFHPSFSDLEPTTGVGDVYDAYNEHFIVEYKYRNDGRSYPSQMIEKHKVDNLMKSREGRRVLYVSLNGNTYHIYDLTKMEEENYDYQWKTSYGSCENYSDRQRVRDRTNLPNSDTYATFTIDGKRVK